MSDPSVEQLLIRHAHAVDAHLHRLLARVSDAFFIPDGDSFVSTDWTRGPWDPRSQHAGPSSALLGRAFERLEPAGLQVARFTIEILKPIPIGRLTVVAKPVRTGRRVQFAEATLTAGDELIARASAWRIKSTDGRVQPTPDEAPPFAGPLDSKSFDTPVAWNPERAPSYLTAMEWRFARGTFLETGPASAWMRMRHPLVEGEEIAPLSRVLIAADSGNGISSEADFEKYVYINTELSVHLTRMPEGEWVCLDAVTRIDASGVGLAQSILWDERARIGGGAQSLLVAPR